MISLELESQKKCVSTEDLSKVLTKMVYKSNSTDQRINSMYKMLSKYPEKIENDCKILRLDPAIEFDAPESLKKKQVSVKHDNDKYENVNHDLKFDVDKKSIVSQEILEDIGKKVWKVQISPNCKVNNNIDKSNQLKIDTDECTSIKAMEPNESLNDTNQSNESKGDDKSMPVLEAFWGPQDILRNTKSKIPKEDKRKSVKRKLTYEKKQHLTKSILCQIDIPPSLPKPSSSTTTGNSLFHDKSSIQSIDKLLSDVIILVKKRNLDARKRDTEILQQLENYLHSIHRENLSE
ncbi:hypothetical protein HCN44_000179 [Aphidius gifuensis]|uniref:Uncharacterized protein n=2 Tax=Aphidius gifuensis TaxID=684658 RepID=A0A835CN19_APHGI|nr:hypothetical protein HCN44_000179 [Aphidius gifuensis]